MPFDRNPETGKMQFSYTNFLATLVFMQASVFFFWISFVVTKAELKDNSILNQITIVEITIITLVLNYYFGNSNNSAKQAQQITEMQKTATKIALNTSGVNTEVKVDKAVKIAELKAALEKLEPGSEDAKKILAELEILEKKD